MQGEFKKSIGLTERVELSKMLRTSHPKKYPIIVETCKLNTKPLYLRCCKYVSPGDMTVGAFLKLVREQCSVAAKQPIFLYCGSALIAPTATIEQTYTLHKDDDGFLYMTVTHETTPTVLQVADYAFSKVLDGSRRVARTLGLHIF